MKKILLIISIFISFFTFSSCSKDESVENKVIVSCYPLYDVLTNIVGTDLEVINLTGNTAEPHEYEITTSDLRNMESAKALFLLGLNFEEYSSSLPESINSKTFITTDGLDILTYNNASDPHVWQNPLNMIKIGENVLSYLIEFDSTKEDLYTSNFNTYKEKLEELDTYILNTLSTLENRNVVCAHNAFSYYGKRYNINFISAQGLSSDDEASASKISEIVNKMKELNLTTVFYEVNGSDKVATTIASEVNGKTDTINTLEYVSKDDINNGINYISIMKENTLKILNS